MVKRWTPRNEAPAQDDLTTVFTVKPSPGFVETPYIQDLTRRALCYLEAGFPVHFRGPSGSGKTTLALNVANLIGRPVVLIYGDDEFATSDLVGGGIGFRRKLVIDNFVRSVYKREERVERQWVDGRLLTACKYGYTLVYDEFSRSRPEANNALLSILEEKIVELPGGARGERYLKVHPDFRAIFTSNPEEYAGVHKTQDALQDRMITIELGDFDLETEAAITASRSGIAPEDAEKIARLVREYRERMPEARRLSVRATIMIAKVLKTRGGRPVPEDPVFGEVCADILGPQAGHVLAAGMR